MMALPQTLPVNKISLIKLVAFGLFVLCVAFWGTEDAMPGVKYVFAAIGLLCWVYAAVSTQLSMCHLQLDIDGITIKIALRPPRRINFVDVSPDGFAVVKTSALGYQVMWRYKLGAEPSMLLRRLNFLIGEHVHQDGLVFNYAGRNTRQMCELLNTVFTQKKHTYITPVAQTPDSPCVSP
jgi:hypothetical protein